MKAGLRWRTTSAWSLGLAALTCAIGLLAAGGSAAPAWANDDRVVLSVGHADAVAVFYEDGELKARVNDDTSPPAVIREADEVLFHAKPESMVHLPPPGQLPPDWEFLREIGDPIWILPQTQDHDLLWPGWSSEGIPWGDGTFVDGELTWTLHEIRGPGGDPAPGGFAMYIDGVATIHDILFNTLDGLPESTTMRTGTHAHFNWAFGSEGLYRFTFEVAGDLVGGGTVSTGPVEYRFFVGDLDDLPGDPPSRLTFTMNGPVLLGAAQRKLRLRGVEVSRQARLRTTIHTGTRQAARRGNLRVARVKGVRRVGPNRRRVDMPLDRRLSRGAYWARVEAKAGGRTVTRVARVRVRR